MAYLCIAGTYLSVFLSNSVVLLCCLFYGFKAVHIYVVAGSLPSFLAIVLLLLLFFSLIGLDLLLLPSLWYFCNYCGPILC
jgi:hypothetical protein